MSGAPHRGVRRSANGSVATQTSEVDATSTLQDLQAEIASRMRHGDHFDTVEEEVIDASMLPEAERAALWLYGWSFVDWRLQRREAVEQLDQLADDNASALRAIDILRAAGADRGSIGG